MDRRQHDEFYNVAPFKKDRMECLFDTTEKRNFQQIIEEEGIGLRLDFTQDAQARLRLFPEFEEKQDDKFAYSEQGEEVRSTQQLLRTFDNKPAHLRRFSQPSLSTPRNLRR